MQLSYLTDKHIESAEDTAIRSLLEAQLAEALALLSEEEQTLIHSIYFEDVFSGVIRPKWNSRHDSAARPYLQDHRKNDKKMQ